MTKHMTGTREEWLAARLELLEAEKELTRRSDELARRRQQLPWVRIDKEYVFDTTRENRRCVICLPDARRWVQRRRRPPGQPRRHAFGGVAGAARAAAGVQAADGVDVSRGVLLR